MSKNCRTHNAVYETEIHQRRVSCVVFLPAGIENPMLDDTIIQRIHDGMENALAPLFPQYGRNRPGSRYLKDLQR